MIKPGELTLRGQLDLADMLRPAVQPGSEIDYEYPPEVVTVSFKRIAENATLATRRAEQIIRYLAEGLTCLVHLALRRAKGRSRRIRMTTTDGKAAIDRRVDDKRRQPPAAFAAPSAARAVGRSEREGNGYRRSNAARRSSKVGAGPAATASFSARRPHALSATQFTGGAETSARTCRTSSIAITPPSCATSLIRASRSIQTIFHTPWC